jgi:hypothetical protein
MESKETATPQMTEKEVRSMVEQQLEKALIGWREELGEKKFKRRIKKAGRLFSKKLHPPAVKPKKSKAKRKNIAENKKKNAA